MLCVLFLWFQNDSTFGSGMFDVVLVQVFFGICLNLRIYWEEGFDLGLTVIDQEKSEFYGA